MKNSLQADLILRNKRAGDVFSRELGAGGPTLNHVVERDNFVNIFNKKEESLLKNQKTALIFEKDARNVMKNNP